MNVIKFIFFDDSVVIEPAEDDHREQIRRTIDTARRYYEGCGCNLTGMEDFVEIEYLELSADEYSALPRITGGVHGALLSTGG